LDKITFLDQVIEGIMDHILDFPEKAIKVR
jgi:hypothetical protein